jgi:flotillin
MKGQIGEAEKQGKTKQEISKIDAETAVLETQRRSEKALADAQLTNRQTELDMDINLKKINAQRQAEMLNAELQKQVDVKRAETELERLRARDVTKSTAAKESAQQAADGTYYTETKQADGQMYAQKIEADTHGKQAYLSTYFPIMVAYDHLLTVSLQSTTRARLQRLPSSSNRRKLKV